MTRDDTTLEALAQHLWDEREVVTYLLYRLTVTKLLLAADERRFLSDALREVDDTIERLRHKELRRDQTLRDVADGWQADPASLTLRDLARLAPAPYDLIFREHLRAFHDLAAEIEQVADANRALAHHQLDEVRATIDLITGAPQEGARTYDAHGQIDGDARVGGHLRKAL